MSAPEDYYKMYEIIDGKRVIKSHLPVASFVVGRLLRTFSRHLEGHDVGWALPNVLFGLDGPQSQRRPDFAFVSYERWPSDARLPSDDPWWVVPELAIDISNPPNT